MASKSSGTYLEHSKLNLSTENFYKFECFIIDIFNYFFELKSGNTPRLKHFLSSELALL